MFGFRKRSRAKKRKIFSRNVPPKVIQNLLSATAKNMGSYQHGGRAYTACRTPYDLTLRHYGTMILYISLNEGRYCIGSGAFSNSDRDAINSALICEGIDDRVHINHGKIVSEDGKDRIYGVC